MSGRIGVAELRQKLASILDSVGDGSVFLVTRSGRDLAVIGPASGSVSKLAREADDVAGALRKAQESKVSALAEVARLRTRIDQLEDELSDARELNTSLNSRS